MRSAKAATDFASDRTIKEHLMRFLRIILPLSVCAGPAFALDMPPRKPGLWEIRMVLENRNTPPTVMQHCIDAATDKEMNTVGANRREECSKQEVTRAGETIVIDSVCQMGPTSVTSHGIVSGNFDSAYTVKVTSKREGGRTIPGVPAETNMTVEAKYLGACKADQKPGDMMMGNGMKMNVRDMPRGVPKQ
jgi:hypothetical protein